MDAADPTVRGTADLQEITGTDGDWGRFRALSNPRGRDASQTAMGIGDSCFRGGFVAVAVTVL